jgi:RNA-binding protein
LKLTSKQRSHLKNLAHDLDPTASVGKNGLTDEVIVNIDKALSDHELIKVKFQAMKDEKEGLTTSISERTGAELIDIIGHIAIFYRQNEDVSSRKVIID